MDSSYFSTRIGSGSDYWQPQSSAGGANPPSSGPGFAGLLQESSLRYQEPPRPAPPVAAVTGGREEKSVPQPGYEVRPGDTLSGIVAGKLRRNGLSYSRGDLYGLVNQVARDNKLTNPDRIIAGQNLNTSRLHDPQLSTRLTARGTRAGGTASRISVATGGSPAPNTAAGIAPAPTAWPQAANGLQTPAIGRVTSEFGPRSHPILGNGHHHDGIDIGLPAGTPLRAIAPGTVTFAGENGSYGLTVEIDHGEGLSSRYAHLSELRVSPGQRIDGERIIARSGRSGLANGPHLHLEVHRDGRPVDPLSLIGQAVIEGDTVLAAEEGQYTVRHGDTMGDIVARELNKRGVNYSRRELFSAVQQLAAANGLNNPDRIFAGQRLDLSSLETLAARSVGTEQPA